MTADLYKRPDRAAIAAQVTGQLPGAQHKPQPERSPLEWFAVNVRAGLKARGWTNADLAERAQCNPMTIGRAVNGAGNYSMDTAVTIARVLGRTLAEMVSPYTCGTCSGMPPSGFTCNECGTEGERPS